MLNWDRFKEIYRSLMHHKLRNFLAGFGVAWGIFILIILMGAGQGLQDGMMKIFSSYAQNSLWVYAGQISETVKNKTEGEKLYFSNELLNNIKIHFYQIKNMTPEVTYNENSTVSYNKESQSGNIKGVGLDYFKIKLLELESGRFLNQIDIYNQRDVCVIGHNIADILNPNANMIGEYINISDNWFKVIGVLDGDSNSNYSNRNAVFIPIHSYNNSFGKIDEYFTFGMLLNEGINSRLFEDKLREYLSRKLNFDINDRKAIYVMNQNEQVKQFNTIFSAVKLFLWFVGISLLLTGIIGISNIMLVIVKERTKEIGIRKAIGARSKTILIMIISESIIITLTSGIIGMILGMIVVKIGDFVISKLSNAEKYLIDSFSVNIPIIVGALILLTISGAIAGIVPANKAANVMPVKALNDD